MGIPTLVGFMTGGAIKDPAHTGLSQAINRGPIRKFLLKYANVYVTIQSHGLSAGAQTHYVTANGVRGGLRAIPTRLSRQNLNSLPWGKGSNKPGISSPIEKITILARMC